LGGVLENRREFLLFEGARVATAGIAVLLLGAWFGGARDPRIVLSLVSFALVSLVGLSLAAILGQRAPIHGVRSRFAISGPNNS